MRAVSERRVRYRVRGSPLLPTEAQVQDAIVQGLRLLGYEVLETGRWRQQTRCPGCGAWHTPHTGYGNTPGCPDVLVAHTRWGNRWLGLEVKAPGAATLLGTVAPGRIRAEQRRLADLGFTVIVHSWEEALSAVREVGDGGLAGR